MWCWRRRKRLFTSPILLLSATGGGGGGDLAKKHDFATLFGGEGNIFLIAQTPGDVRKGQIQSDTVRYSQIQNTFARVFLAREVFSTIARVVNHPGEGGFLY